MSLLIGRADAVLVPETMKSKAAGPRQWHRVKAILDIAEPMLGVIRSRGDLGYMRPVEERARDGSRYLLCTRGQLDTLLYPKTHPKEGQPRFRWLDDGMIRIGHFIDPKEGDIRVE